MEENSQPITTTLYKQSMKLMGNRFEITVAGDNTEWADAMITAAVSEIQRIEKLLTTFSNTSETFLINEHAGISPVAVSDETLQLVKRSLRISTLTQGAFDITYGSIDKRLWNFDKEMTSLPSSDVAKERVRLVNYRNVMIDEDAGTIFLKEKGMRIGFGGIGKGYAAEMAKKILKQKGVQSGIVNASGDLTAWGLQPNGKPWTIGIAHPDAADKPFSYLEISDMAVATSGNYEKYVTIGGRKYSHTINPRTGLPITGIKSVTIICSNAEMADAITTPVMIMGIEAGLDMVNQLKGVGCILIDDNNRIFTSANINLI